MTPAERPVSRIRLVHLKATFYVTESDPSTGEIVRRTNSFDAFVIDA